MKAYRYNTLSVCTVVALLWAFTIPSQAQTYSTVVLSDNPALYYRLDETSGTTAKDEVGVSTSTPDGRNPATYQKIGTDPSGGFTLGQSGVINDANSSVLFSRDTTNLFPPSYGRVFAPTTTGLPTGNTSFTMEAWIVSDFQGDSSTIDLPNILSYGTNAVNQKVGLQLAKSGSQSRVGQYFYGNDYFVNVPDLTGARHYLATTYSGAGTQLLTFYLDGALIGSQTVTGTPDIQQGNLEIGVLSPFSQDSFAGSIDEVAIYGSALSADRIQAHYNAGISTPEPGSLALLGGMVVSGLVFASRRKRIRGRV